MVDTSAHSKPGEYSGDPQPATSGYLKSKRKVKRALDEAGDVGAGAAGAIGAGAGAGAAGATPRRKTK